MDFTKLRISSFAGDEANMEMNRIFKYYKNRKGITLVLMAFMLAVLLMLAGLAIDIAYMYYVKNQLQVAADAAALAGAANLDGTNSTDQIDAREKAWEFACKNTAAGSSVYLVTNNNDPADNTFCNEVPDGTLLNIANSDTINDDIVVGYWDGSNFSTTIPSGQIANAVRVRARRTEGSPGGPARVFIGQIFRIINADWTFMSARASAIAAPKPPFIGPFPICLPSCIIDTPLDGQWDYKLAEDEPILCTDDSESPPGQFFYLGPSAQQNNIKRPGLAWSNFDQVYDSCPTNQCGKPVPKDILPYVKGKQPPELCNKFLCTTNGSMAGIQKELLEEFNKNKKDYKFTVGATEITVNGWQIFVPAVSDISCSDPKQSCPGAQEGDVNPYKVERFAKVLMTEVDPPKGFRLVGFDNPRVVTKTVECKKGQKTINRKITSIGCTDCSLPLLGEDSNVRLVK